MRRAVYGVTAMTLLSYGGEYMAFTSILAWLDSLLLNAGYTSTQAYGFGFLVSSSYLLFSGVLAIPLGFLADIFGRRLTAVTGCILAGISIMAVSLTGSIREAGGIITSMSALLLLIGIGHATYTTSALAYAGDVTSAEDVGEAYGYVETAEYAMFMFGTPLGFVLAQAYGNQFTFFITGGILFVGALIAVFGMPEKGKQGKAFVPDWVKAPAGSRWRLLYQAISDREVQTSLIAVFFVSVGFTLFRVYLTQYGTSGSGIAVGPYLISIMAASSIFAAIPIGKLVDTTRKRAVIMAGGFVAEGVALALIFFQPSVLSLFLWSLVFGAAVMLVRVPQAVVIAERTSLENRASAMGANHGIEHVGYGLGAFLGGLLLLYLGFTTLDTFLLVGGISIGLGVVLVPVARALKMS